MEAEADEEAEWTGEVKEEEVTAEQVDEETAPVYNVQVYLVMCQHVPAVVKGVCKHFKQGSPQTQKSHRKFLRRNRGLYDSQKPWCNL